MDIDGCESFNVKVDISFEEFREKKMHRLYWSKRSQLISILLDLGILTALIVLLIIGKRVLIQLLGWTVIIALQPLSMYIGAKRFYKRTWGKSYTISDCGVICERNTSEASLSYKWKDIRKVDEYEAAFMFYFSFAEFEEPFIIPKSCFADEGELIEVKELLERNVKRYRVKIKASTGGNDGR